jgi:hypothetical protein
MARAWHDDAHVPNTERSAPAQTSLVGVDEAGHALSLVARRTLDRIDKALDVTYARLVEGV